MDTNLFQVCPRDAHLQDLEVDRVALVDTLLPEEEVYINLEFPEVESEVPVIDIFHLHQFRDTAALTPRETDRLDLPQDAKAPRRAQEALA